MSGPVDGHGRRGKAWDDYMLRSYKPYDHFAGDAIHGNSRSKQIVARILATGRYEAVPCCEARLEENRPPSGLTKNCTPVHSLACCGVRCGTLVAWPPTRATT